MKQEYRIYTAILIIVLSIGSLNLFSQCDLELQEQIENEIKKDKVEFLRKFSVELDSDEKVSSFSMVLSKGTWYRFYIYESDKFKGKGYFEMTTNNTLLGSTRHELSGKTFHYFDFKCNKTTDYKLSVIKTSGENYCAELVLALVSKKEKEGGNASGIDLQPETDVYVIAEEMPVFVNGKDSTEEFREWVSKQLIYPEEAKKQKIEGKVYVQFIVSDKGMVKDVKVVREAHPILDKYAVELISKCPKWSSPGYENGEAVNVLFTFPVIFKM